MKDEEKNSVLHIAAKYGYDELVQLLIEKDYDLNMKNIDGETALCLAVFHNNKSIVELLVNKGVDINIIRNDGSSPLSLALYYNFPDISELLIDKGARAVTFPFEHPKINLGIICPNCRGRLSIGCQHVHPQNGNNYRCHLCGYFMFIPPTIYNFSKFWKEAGGTSLVSDWAKLIR